MSLRERFNKALGLRPRRLEPVVRNDAGRDPDELAGAAARTEDALAAPPPAFEPGVPLRGISTDDLEDYSLRPDYLEARAKREAERKTARPAELVVLGNVRPKP